MLVTWTGWASYAGALDGLGELCWYLGWVGRVMLVPWMGWVSYAGTLDGLGELCWYLGWVG